MQITPPFGYDDIVPLDRKHKVLLPAATGASVPEFARRVNAMAISYSEFAIAQRDYPIVFTSTDGGATYAPLAVLGLAIGQNLFVDDDGRWAAGCYVPAFVRRYPFCISRVYIDGVAQDERLVCVEKSYIDQGGLALFDPAGNPTPDWTARERLLAEYEKDLDLTAQMCAFFAKLDLFSPFTMRVKHGGETGVTMHGMFCIDEAKFGTLKAASHKALATKGLAARAYAHLFSLPNFQRLYDRAADREDRRRKARRA